MSAETINDERLNAAIRYLLQLAIELRTDNASYADGAKVVEQVVSALEAHRSDRMSLNRIALVAELVDPIHERLKLEAAGQVMRADTCRTISKWLRRKGITRSAGEVAQLLEQPIRAGARSRTELEKLLDRLASLLGISQSQFEKIVGVVERGKETKGRLGNPLIHERAALDSAPTRTELVLYALHALDVDEETGQNVVALLPEEHIELMYDSIEERAHAAEVLAAARQAASAKHMKRAPDEPADSGDVD